MPKPLDRRERNREHDAKRRAEQPWRKWYKLPVWQGIRRRQLADQPLCERHLKRGELVRATVVNHVGRHNGIWDRFIAGPFESVCKACHDREIQAEEHGRFEAVDADGWPVGRM